MATIKVSKQHNLNMEKYIDCIYKKYNKKISKKSIIDRVINNYHHIIDKTMIRPIHDDMVLVAVDNEKNEILKTDKERLHQPMYLILNACLDQFFSKSKKKNVVLCQFKKTMKSYAFYFNPEELTIKKGNIIRVQSANPSDTTKIIENNVQVKDFAYVKDAKNKFKPVLKVIR